MKKILIFIIILLSFSTIVKAFSKIDSIQFIGTTADSLVFIVHSSADIDVFEYYLEYEENSDNIRVNMLYSGGWNVPDCYCPIQTKIKIKKDIYSKAIVSLMIRKPIGGTEKNPEYSDYGFVDSIEIDLLNIANINNTLISNKFLISPNPVQKTFFVDTEGNKTTNLEIYNPQGNLLLCKNVTNKAEIDISFLPQGLYFIVIDKNYIYKIIKE